LNQGASASSSSDVQTVNLVNTIKKYLPTLEEFKIQRNDFNKLVKEMTDLMVQKMPALTPLVAARMLNSPINYLSLHSTWKINLLVNIPSRIFCFLPH